MRIERFFKQVPLANWIFDAFCGFYHADLGTVDNLLDLYRYYFASFCKSGPAYTNTTNVTLGDTDVKTTTGKDHNGERRCKSSSNTVKLQVNRVFQDKARVNNFLTTKKVQLQ